MNCYLIQVLLTVLLGIISMMDYIITRKPRKLIYPLIWAYYFIGMPVFENFVNDMIVGTTYVVIGFVFTIIFSYLDIMKTDKEKNIQL